MDAVDVLAETSPQYAAFCYHACKNTRCATNHPSEFRGNKKINLRWDQSKIGSGLVLSDEGTVVEFPGAPLNTLRIARASTACTANSNGVCEWDVIVESVGLYDGNNTFDVGMILESHQHFDGNWVSGQWGIHSYGQIISIRGSERQNIKIDKPIQNGDIISFHLNFNNRTCSVSINGRNYGVAWKDLPRDVNLYPAVTVCKNLKCRIRGSF